MVNFNSSVGGIYVGSTNPNLNYDNLFGGDCPYTTSDIQNFDGSYVLGGKNTLYFQNIPLSSNIIVFDWQVSLWDVDQNGNLTINCFLDSGGEASVSGRSFTFEFDFLECCPTTQTPTPTQSQTMTPTETPTPTNTPTQLVCTCFGLISDVIFSIDYTDCYGESQNAIAFEGFPGQWSLYVCAYSYQITAGIINEEFINDCFLLEEGWSCPQ